MFDYDEAFHDLEQLDSRGRQALKLAGKVWEEIYGGGRERRPFPLSARYLAELSERSEQVRVLRERLADALDGRETAESVLEKVRALATHWGLDTELDRALADWRPHCRRQPRSFVHEERIDLLEEEVRRLQRESKAAREAQFVAIDRMRQARIRAETAEAEVGRLRAQLNF